MQPYLIFTLSATIAAMGELAGHERRGTLLWPGRSAVLGLLGAAMGLKREDDFSALDALHMGVAVFEDGNFMRDYHTVQTVPTARAKKPNSRPEALQMAKYGLNTVLTTRDYLTDVLYGVVVWGGNLPPLLAALQQPCYSLYLGRKACPLSSPLGAQIIEAALPEDALQHLVLPPWHQNAMASKFITDAQDGDDHVERRHDMAIDRRLWHFSSRLVAFHQVNIVPKGAI